MNASPLANHLVLVAHWQHCSAASPGSAGGRLRRQDTNKMSTTLLIPQDGGQAEKGGIVDDFMYGSNVATSHIYVRMGELTVHRQLFLGSLPPPE